MTVIRNQRILCSNELFGLNISLATSTAYSVRRSMASVVGIVYVFIMRPFYLSLIGSFANHLFPINKPYAFHAALYVAAHEVKLYGALSRWGGGLEAVA